MPTYEVNAPDGKKYKVNAPDNASQQDAINYVQKEFYGNSTSNTQETSYPIKIGADAFPDTLREVLRNTDWGTRNIAGAGTALSNLWEGAKQFVGQGDKQAIEANKIIRSEAPIGSFAGDVALTALPFGMAGNSVKAAGAVGAGYGLLQPVSGDQTLGNIAKGKVVGGTVGGVTSMAGQALANGAANWLTNKANALASAQANNAINDAIRQKAVSDGLVLPPSAFPDTGVLPRLAEGLSGKAKTEQLGRVMNQENFVNKLARRAIGLPDNTYLDQGAVNTVLDNAYQAGYKPIENIGRIATDAQYVKDLDAIISNHTGAAKSFPNAIPDEVGKLVDSYRIGGFDSADALQVVQTLRNGANEAFRNGNNNMGFAYKQISSALEDQIERNLASASNNQTAQSMLNNFIDARVLRAKAHSVGDAIKESTGNVDASKLATMLQNKKPLTGDLQTIAQIANNPLYRKYVGLPQSGDNVPLTALDFMTSAPSSVLGLHFGGVPGLIIGGALPASRVAARYGILSKPAQSALANPSYAVPLSSRMLGGLLQQSPVIGNALSTEYLTPAISGLNTQQR